ncbi:MULTISPECIES: AAA family ATPase [unclassified Streptomyces]|uniref:AAA family ATPase n=1 Tax=unclassified Streptomyces TaxID=2593676 RepID=UPI00381EB126
MSGLRVADPGAAVILVTGVMASGKSTVAQGLAERLPRSVHVRGDVFRRMVVSGRGTGWPAPIASAVGSRRRRCRHRHRHRHLRRRMCGNGCPCTAGAAISIARRP